MKRYLNKWLTSHQIRQGLGLPFVWGGGELIVAAILIVGIVGLGSSMIGRWINGGGEAGLLPVPLHSLGKADYSVDEVTRPVPAIGLEIIQDLLGIEEPPQTGGLPGIALITASEPSPTPTPTLAINIEIPWTATAKANDTDSATVTPAPRRSATPLPTAQATSIPTSTISPPDTPIPTSTPGISATSTPLPTQIPPTATSPIPATSMPSPSPLPPPTNTPNPTSPPVPPATARPTRSSTLAVTPTAQYTPVVPVGTPSLP